MMVPSCEQLNTIELQPAGWKEGQREGGRRGEEGGREMEGGREGKRGKGGGRREGERGREEGRREREVGGCHIILIAQMYQKCAMNKESVASTMVIFTNARDTLCRQ